MQERKNSEAGNEKEVDYGRKSGQDNTSENVIENRPEKRVKNKGGNKTGEFIARKRKEKGTRNDSEGNGRAAWGYE